MTIPMKRRRSSPREETASVRELRAAFFLRCYTDKAYNENDKQNIRPYITELGL